MPREKNEIPDMIENLDRIARELAQAEARKHADEIAWLNGLRQLPRDQQAQALDRSFIEELEELQEKLRRLKRDRAPNPDQQWAVIQELINLLYKLVFKVFWLQGQTPPAIDPRV